MSSSARLKVTGRGIPLPGDDIDTDRIIPARYLREITFEALGKYAFQDERFDQAGKARPHPLNDPRYKGGTVLLVGRNFGCGSSREHAPQSLMRMGIEAFIGESFAEIFSGNCTALGLPAARVSHEDGRAIVGLVEADPGAVITVDLDAQSISVAGRRFGFTMPDADRRSLLTGEWDTTSVLLARKDAIAVTAGKIPYVSGWNA
ncbi:MAG TPA: 3-isopropylmalate dehydratase small subunit [Spirochaetia bacterium]|nr:3-isopropylmalate dehydratase small subunit [Spirochaetia bacterium]HTZ50884.1 3-isopropylmalate dehydratase small subunit [Spirochaetia bacterium]